MRDVGEKAEVWSWREWKEQGRLGSLVEGARGGGEVLPSGKGARKQGLELEGEK